MWILVGEYKIRILHSPRYKVVMLSILTIIRKKYLHGKYQIHAKE